MGLSDPRARTWVACLDYIQKARPKVAVLENVPQLVKNPKFKETMYDSIVHVLSETGYDVHSQVIKTEDFGVPQARERLYIIAIARKARTRKFSWPVPIAQEPLMSFLGLDTAMSGKTTDVSQILPSSPQAKNFVKRALLELLKTHKEHEVIKNMVTVVDIDSSEKWFHYRTNVFPTITASRGARRGFWIVANGTGRQVTLVDLLKLQGFRLGAIGYRGAGVTTARIGHMCGNAMSCNVLRALLPEVLRAVGIKPSLDCKP